MNRKLISIVTVAMLAATACSGSATPAPTAAPTAAAQTAAAPSTAASGAPAASSSASTGYTWTNGILQPLADGFPNKPITLLNGDDPGSSDGIYARTMQALLSKMAPVAVEVVDKPGPQFGMWTMTLELNKTPTTRDGYSAAVQSYSGGALDLVTAPVTRDLGLTMADINPVVATEKDLEFMIGRADAPWADYNGLVQYAKAHPGQVKYLARNGSQLDIAANDIMSQGGWTAKRILGGSSEKIATDIGAGVADFGMAISATALAHFQTGKVKVLLAIGSASPAPWAGGPTTESVGMPNMPWGGIRGLGVSAETPEAHRLWLFELFSKAGQTPDYASQRTAITPGLQVVTLDKAALLDIMNNAIKVGEPIIRALKLAWDQQ